MSATRMFAEFQNKVHYDKFGTRDKPVYVFSLYRGLELEHKTCNKDVRVSITCSLRYRVNNVDLSTIEIQVSTVDVHVIHFHVAQPIRNILQTDSTRV